MNRQVAAVVSAMQHIQAVHHGRAVVAGLASYSTAAYRNQHLRPPLILCEALPALDMNACTPPCFLLISTRVALKIALLVRLNRRVE